MRMAMRVLHGNRMWTTVRVLMHIQIRVWIFVNPDQMWLRSTMRPTTHRSRTYAACNSTALRSSKSWVPPTRERTHGNSIGRARCHPRPSSSTRRRRRLLHYLNLLKIFHWSQSDVGRTLDSSFAPTISFQLFALLNNFKLVSFMKEKLLSTLLFRTKVIQSFCKREFTGRRRSSAAGGGLWTVVDKWLRGVHGIA